MARSNTLSLKLKTMAMCLGLTLALAGLSAYGLRVLKQQQESASYATLAARAESLANAIASRFYEHYVDIKVLALNPVLQGGDHAAIVREFDAIARQTNTFTLMLFVDTKGHLVAVNSKTPEGESLDLPSLYARDFTQYEWWRAPIAGRTSDAGDRHLSGTYVETMNNLPALSAALGRKVRGNKFSTAVRNEAGEIIGVLAGAADERWYHEPFTQTYLAMKQEKFPHTSLMLLDRSGKPLEHELGDDKLDENSMVADFSAQVQAGKPGSFLLTAPDGTEVMAGFYPLRGWSFADELGWSVVMQDSKSELLAHIVEMQREFNIALGVAIALCAIGSYIFATRLGRDLTSVEGGLAQSTRAISTAASQLLRSSTELSEAASEQAKAIQQTAASVDEVSAMAKKSAENATHSQQTSVISRKAAEEGREGVQEMIQVIAAISESNANITAAVGEGNRQISEIVKVIGEIGNKTKVINDIVFQTKLLSFNASVEAARAGEHGKGFAVVAEEVGNLARMSGDAAKEIAAMLDSSIQKVESIVGQTQSRVEQLVVAGRSKVEAGAQVAAACGKNLSNILALVQEVEGKVNEIASASNEQAQGVAEINDAMNSLDQVIQRNNTVARSAADGSRSLTQEAHELSGIIARLHRLVQGADMDAEGSAGHETRRGQEMPPQGVAAAMPVSRAASRDRHRPAAGAQAPWPSRAQPAPSAYHTGQVDVEGAVEAPAMVPLRDDARFKEI